MKSERYLVEAYFADQATAERLKAVVRKPVMHSGHGGDLGCVGWEYATKKRVLDVFKRLCRVTSHYVYVADYANDGALVASRKAR